MVMIAHDDLRIFEMPHSLFVAGWRFSMCPFLSQVQCILAFETTARQGVNCLNQNPTGTSQEEYRTFTPHFTAFQNQLNQR
jgi:hypothetical protein